MRPLAAQLFFLLFGDQVDPGLGAMHRAIRGKLAEIYGEAGAGVRILYGGSVNAGNASELLAADEVGGALVGGASLAAESFATIISAAATPTED